MESSPPLRAKGLDGDYRVLADFNDTVLAGHPTGQGVEFVILRVENPFELQISAQPDAFRPGAENAGGIRGAVRARFMLNSRKIPAAVVE